LLESGKGSATVARYSFIGSDPYLTLVGKHGRSELRTSDGMTTHQADPFSKLAQFFLSSPIARPEGVPPFFGGAVGYFGYDLVRSFETIPILAQDDQDWPDLQFMFVDLLTTVDHRTGTVFLIFCPPRERQLSEPREKLYREGCDRLAELEARMTSSCPMQDAPLPLHQLALTPDQSRQAYIDRAGRCLEYIAAGDIYQVNLSHRFTLNVAHRRETAPPDHQFALQLYQRLRAVNPSPFSALLSFDNMSLISCSPERLVRLQGRQVDTRPIAGTRPRGHDQHEDQRLIRELLVNQKERAEHLMLVDLERNDLGRVCEFGSVRVNEFMSVEQYSHVSHIVSNVTGRLRQEANGFDLIKAMFPGGTITGVPKIRCMEIIDELEPVRRGPYSGALGYMSWSGDLDLNILIRTLVLAKQRGYLQVGAGIVADSDPGREHEETLCKAEAFFRALRES
jgi:aminodeoxychorismate synthase component I